MNDLTEYLKKAFKYKNNGDYKKSIDYFYKALAIDNQSSEIMAELACLYSKLCQYDRAISFYEQIILQDSSNYYVKLQLALLCKSIKDYKRAEEILVKLFENGYELKIVASELFHILSINRNYEKIILYFNKCSNKLSDSIIFYYVALAYSKIGKEDIADEFYKKSFSIDEHNILSGKNVARFLFEKGHIDSSESLALNLLKLSEDSELLYLLAEIAYTKFDIDSAIKYYSYAIKVNSQNALYYFKLAIAFSLKGFFKEAEESYCKAISLEPENTLYNYALAYMYYMNKKMDLSERLVDYILTIDPENSQALSLKVLLLIDKKEIATAGKIIEELDLQQYKDDFVYYVQSIYYSNINLLDKSVDRILKAIKLNSQSIEYKYQLANLKYNIEDYETSIELCDEIIGLNPKYIQSYILLSKINLIKKEYEKVRSYIRIVLELDKNVAEAYYILAEVNFLLQEYNEALENYKIAVSINPGVEEYYARVALCYYLSGDYECAYFYYKEAAEFDITNADYRYYMAKCSIEYNDVENALSNFSLMKRLAPANIKYITEYADYVASIGRKNRAVAILNSLVKEVNSIEEKEKVKKYIKNLKKGS